MLYNGRLVELWPDFADEYVVMVIIAGPPVVLVVLLLWLGVKHVKRKGPWFKGICKK